MQTKNIQIKNPIYRKSYNIINSVVVDTRWSWIEYRVAAQIFSQFLLKFIRNKPFIFIKYHHFKCVKRCAIFYTVAYEIVRHPIFHYGIAMEEEFFLNIFFHGKGCDMKIFIVRRFVRDESISCANQSSLLTPFIWIYCKKIIGLYP